jgi:hypothetical protein
MARPDDWIDRSVIFGTDMYGGDTMGVLEEVNDRGVVVRHEIVEIESESEIEAELEAELRAEFELPAEGEPEVEPEVELQSIFYPWTKINWMYHPE